MVTWFSRRVPFKSVIYLVPRARDCQSFFSLVTAKLIRNISSESSFRQITGGSCSIYKHKMLYTSNAFDPAIAVHVLQFMCEMTIYLLIVTVVSAVCGFLVRNFPFNFICHSTKSYPNSLRWTMQVKQTIAVLYSVALGGLVRTTIYHTLHVTQWYSLSKWNFSYSFICLWWWFEKLQFALALDLSAKKHVRPRRKHNTLNGKLQNTQLTFQMHSFPCWWIFHISNCAFRKL